MKETPVEVELDGRCYSLERGRRERLR